MGYIFSGEAYIKHTTEGVLQSFLNAIEVAKARPPFWQQNPKRSDALDPWKIPGQPA